MHHANLFVGSKEWALNQISEAKEVASPDVSIRTFERMTIEDARVLIHDAHRMPVEGSVRTFIILVNSILPEAQNALLKLLEEPPSTARFYIITGEEHALLPTLRSRLMVLGREEVNSDIASFTSFKALSPGKRLESIGKFIKEENHEWTRSIVVGFEHYAHEKKDARLIREALMIASYWNFPGSSKKMLLEHLALELTSKLSEVHR